MAVARVEPQETPVARREIHAVSRIHDGALDGGAHGSAPVTAGRLAAAAVNAPDLVAQRNDVNPRSAMHQVRHHASPCLGLPAQMSEVALEGVEVADASRIAVVDARTGRVRASTAW